MTHCGHSRSEVFIVLQHATKACFSLLILTSLVACERLFGPRDGAMFCRPSEFLGMVVQIDFRKNRGLWEDVGRPITVCGDTNLACINFPLLISVPPDDDWRSKLPYSWEAGSADFTIEQLVDNTSGQFFITARDSSKVMFYNYSSDQGVLSVRLGYSDEDRWNLCGGRFTFDRLKAWHASVETIER